jgi:valyl-tRNA synthetase
VKLTQDADVLDTWFSSALWPFSTLGWPGRTPALAKFYPTSVLVTGFDIIFFWVARMVMFGLRFLDGQPPFRDVYITGLIRDHDGQKMSKSKGNIIDPLDIVDGIDLEALVKKRTTGLMQPHLAPAIEKATRKLFPQGIEAHGTDALRFTFAALATQGRDIRFDLGRVGGYRNFCNKLWNAARFVTMMVDDGSAADEGPAELSVADRWIRSRLGRTIEAVDAAYADYRFDFAATALYEFTWYEFCDWYLELVKPVMQGEAGEAARRGARRTLLEVLEALLRALHPLMPFITEEIWQRIAPLAGRAGPTIMRAPWPARAHWPADDEAEGEAAWLQRVILAVRQVRGEMNIAPSRRIPLLAQHGTAADARRIERHHIYLARLAGLESVARLADDARPPASATALAGELQLHVPMAGLIDAGAEVERLTKLISKNEGELKKARGKLANENFVRNAPAEVVAQERERIATFERDLAQLAPQLERVRSLLANT